MLGAVQFGNSILSSKQKIRVLGDFFNTGISDGALNCFHIPENGKKPFIIGHIHVYTYSMFTHDP
jgi:hypothetical protein